MKFLLTILFLFSSVFSFANDSLLYKKRLQKIEQLHGWLSKRAYVKIDISKADPNAFDWKIYDTVINVFFDKRALDSVFSRISPNDIFLPSAKYEILKLSIAKFHELAQKQCFRELMFRQATPWLKDVELTKQDLVFLQNNLVQSFLIDGEEFKWTGFEFVDKGTRLLTMPIYLLSESENRKIQFFYNKLKPCK